MHRHKRKILAGHGIVVVTLLAASTLAIDNSDAVLFFTPHGDQELHIGDTIDIDVNITSKVPINAVGTTIKFPPELVSIVGISKANSFLDLWTEDTIIKESEGEMRFSGGTLEKGGLSGTATALTLTLKAENPGEAVIYFENAEVYANDGTGLTVANETRNLSYTIPKPEGDAPNTGIPSLANGAPHSELPSPDLDNSGSVNLVDVSIFVIKMVGTYKPRYDLDGDGSVGLSDLSVLFSHIGD